MWKRNRKYHKQLADKRALFCGRPDGGEELLMWRRMVRVLRALGGASVVVLVVLGVMAVNPVTDRAEAANGYDQDLLNYEMVPAAVTLTMEAGTNGTIRAGDTDGNMGLVRRTASLSIGSTSGYVVYMRANNVNLTGRDTANVIPSITANSTLAQMIDKWGWYGEIGDVAADCNPSGTFKEVPTVNTTIGMGEATSSTVNKKITMCFGTRLSGEKAADTYSNTVTVSVVAEPGQSSTRTFSGITTMQQMTNSICSAAAVNDTTYLRDTRDGKYYWVTKLLDGNCWMSQNLDLNITTSNITAATSDVTANWTSMYSARAVAAYSPQATIVGVTPTGSLASTDTYSWDVGNYVINAPTETTTCGYNGTGPASCTMFTAIEGRTASTDPNFYRKSTYTGTDGSSCTKAANTSVSTATTGACAQYDAHYTVGNYYQWNAATAGMGGTITDQNATESICPKGWKLPNSGTDQLQKGSFNYMLLQYGLANGDGSSHSGIAGTSGVNGNTYNIALSPLFLVRGGFLNSGIAESFRDAGSVGYYWSSRAGSNPNGTYSLYFKTGVNPSYNFNRYLGLSLRCLFPTT